MVETTGSTQRHISQISQSCAVCSSKEWRQLHSTDAAACDELTDIAAVVTRLLDSSCTVCGL